MEDLDHEGQTASAIVRLSLHRLAVARGLNSEPEVARAAGVQRSAVQKIFNGTQQKFTPATILGMAVKLGADMDTAQALYRLAERTQSRESAFQEPSSAGNELRETPFTLIEWAAHSQDIYAEALIPGWGQCPEYTEKLAEDHPFATPEGTRRNLEARAARFAELFDGTERAIRVVLNEACLLRIAKYDFYPTQAEHLIRLSEEFNVGFYVLPMGAGLHPGMNGKFTILGAKGPTGYANPVELDIVHLEGYGTGGEWVTGDKVNGFHRLFGVILPKCQELGVYWNAHR